MGKPHYTVEWNEEGTQAYVTTHYVLHEHAALARAAGLDPEQITYAPDGEPWYHGAPLEAITERQP